MEVGAWIGEGSHYSNHRQDGGKEVISPILWRSIEGDVNNFRCIDYAVDCVEIICRCNKNCMRQMNLAMIRFRGGRKSS